MMQAVHDNLVRLVGRLYRRLWMLRVVEGMGVGVLAASGAGLILLLILMGRGEAVPVDTLWILLVGGVGGALWAILRRPRVIQAAMEADRQLGLADLLSTALAIVEDSGQYATRPHPTRSDTLAGKSPAASSQPESLAEAFAAAVVAMADARCAELSASSVVLHRLGLRAWGGIGLASALLISVALVAANPLDSQASPWAGVMRGNAGGSEPARVPQIAGMAPRLSPAVVRPIVRDDPNRDENGFNPARASSNTLASETGQSQQTAEAANPEGAGPGVGTSHAKNRGDPLGAEGTGVANATTGRTPAGGVGLPNGEGKVGLGPSGGAVGRGAAARVTPAWKSPAWVGAQEAARAAVQAGQIPQEYQDLVRAYFDR
ncbi:MAG: hypothetical protein ACM359_20920 [Bacillota bacterium]